MPQHVDSYSERAQAFVTELDREYHLHYSGQKADFEIEAISEWRDELPVRMFLHIEDKIDPPPIYLASIDIQGFFDGLHEANHVDLGGMMPPVAIAFSV